MAESEITVVDVQPDVVIVRATCESLDEVKVKLLRTAIAAAAEQQPAKPLVLDLAMVNFMPSLSLAALIRLATDFRARQQRLLVAGLQPQVRDVFVLCRLDRLFDLQEDAAAALRSLRPA
jgi:anti-sigma B factor antagonist